MTITNWNDDRLSELQRRVDHLDERLSAVANVGAANSLELAEIKRHQTRTADNSFATRLALATVILGQFGTILTLVLTHGH